MDKNAITVKDVVELALIELQYMAADFSQRREFYVRSFGTGRFRYTIIKHSNGYGCNRVRSRGYTNSIRSIRTSTRRPYRAATSPAQTIAPRSLPAIVSFSRFACVRSA